jgi:hypothetical protein
MKAKDLAKKLMENPEAEVIVTSDNFELNGNMIPVSSVHPYKGRIESKQFRDAFDYEYYNTNVFVWDENGKVFLKIS